MRNYDDPGRYLAKIYRYGGIIASYNFQIFEERVKLNYNSGLNPFLILVLKKILLGIDYIKETGLKGTTTLQEFYCSLRLIDPKNCAVKGCIFDIGVKLSIFQFFKFLLKFYALLVHTRP